MSGSIDTLMGHIRELESRLEVELAAHRADLKYRIEKDRIVFEEDIARRHREFKVRLLPYVIGVRPLVLLTAPFIYGLIVPLVLLDLFVTIYQRVCFPIYGIQKTRRGDYLVFDRQHLQYLNAVEKLNCAYCSYGNGLIAYVREIAARTEQYWCPIKHAQRMAGEHARHADFADYGDAEGYQRKLGELREKLSGAPADRAAPDQLTSTPNSRPIP